MHKTQSEKYFLNFKDFMKEISQEPGIQHLKKANEPITQPEKTIDAVNKVKLISTTHNIM